MIVFVGSKAQLKQFREHWQRSGILAELERHKTCVLFEPSGKLGRDECFEKFYTESMKPGGAVFIAVHRGNGSEGTQRWLIVALNSN